MGFYRSAFQGWTVARFALCSLLLLVAVVFAGSPLVTEQASAAACRPSVAVTFSNETRVGGEAVSATVTVTANAATGGAPDTLTRIAFTGARNGEVRVQGQPVTVPRTYTLANVTSWSFQIQKLQPGLPTTIFITATDSCGEVAKFAGFGGGSAVATSTPAPTPTLSPTPVPTAPRLLFGLGPEADGALASSFRQSAPVKLLTSWYSSPNDLSWMSGWRNNLVPQAYANGYTLHLVVFTNDPEVSLSTAYGPACGRSYPLSSRFVGDMAQLAQTFAGSGPLYVTLFTEFQTYPCADNTWVGSKNYYRALKDQYLAALAAFRQHAPNAKVSIGWGGWQARWDNPAQGSGRSLFPRFADVMNASDFQRFQAMQSDTNVQDVRDMTSILGAYGPVMLAHYKPDNGSCPAATADLTTMLTDAYLRDVVEDGLFAWSFMDDGIVTCSPQVSTFVRSAVTTYAR